jgi:sirohydrochlorin cobaltochelatase
MTTTTNQALAMVFFGTTADAGLKVYDWIEAQMASRYPQMTVQRAFTSQMVIRRLQERGFAVPNLPELLADFKQQGITQVAVLPFLIVPGQEFGKITAAIAAEPELKGVCAAPLLTDEADYEAVIRALEPEIPVGIPTVIGCHGNEQHDQFNCEIRQFAALIEARHPQVMVATVEGDNPGIAPLARAREMAQTCGAVHFIPLMLVAGDHVMNDIMGDEEDSWKTQVGAATTTCSGPAGMNERILELYCQHLDNAISGGFGGTR